MLRGALRLVHAVTIDVENLSPRPIDIEVRERIPVTREGDDDVEVTLGKVEPAWERWTPDADAPRESRAPRRLSLEARNRADDEEAAAHERTRSRSRRQERARRRQPEGAMSERRGHRAQ